MSTMGGAIKARILSEFHKIALTGRYGKMLELGFLAKVSDKQRGSKNELAKDFLLGLIYAIKPGLTNRTSVAFDNPVLELTQDLPSDNSNRGDCFLSSGTEELAANSFTRAPQETSSALSKLFEVDVKPIEIYVIGLIKGNRDKVWSKDEIILAYNQLAFKKEVSEGLRPKLEVPLLDKAIEELKRKKIVVEEEGGGFRFYNQVSAIKRASQSLSDQFPEIDSLHKLAEKVNSVVREVFGNIDIYGFDGKTGKMRILAGDTEGSSFEEKGKGWPDIEKNGVFDDMLKKKELIRYYPDIKLEENPGGPIFPHNIVRYEERFAATGEAIYIMVPIPGTQDAIAAKIHEWSKIGSHLPNREIFCADPETDQEAVKDNIVDLFKEIARKAGKITSGMTLMQKYARENGGVTPLSRTLLDNGKEEFVDTAEPFSPSLFLSPKMKGYRVINHDRGGKKVVGQIIDNLMDNCKHLKGTIFSSINEIAVDAWGMFPPKFVKRLADVTKAVFLTVDGEKAAYTSATTFYLAEGKRLTDDQVRACKDRKQLKAVRWFEIGITKIKFQKLGLQTLAVYWLSKEAFMEEIGKYISRKGRFKYLNFLLAIPSIIWAFAYARGLINKRPPKEIENIKVPIAFLAVQPTTLGPFLEYANDIYPNPYRPEVMPDQEKIAIGMAATPEGATFDPKTFVVTGDYEGIEHLIPDPAKGTGPGGVLLYKDDRVNKHMYKNLEYEQRKGRDQMVVLNLTIFAFRRYFELMKTGNQERVREKNEKDTVDTVLKVTKGL